jgi:hypothetical protein
MRSDPFTSTVRLLANDCHTLTKKTVVNATFKNLAMPLLTLVFDH